MASLGDLIVRVGGNIDDFRQAMQGVVEKVSEVAGEIEDKLSSISDVGGRLVTLGAQLTAGITVPLVALGTTALETAGKFEQTRIAFNTLAGSAEMANTQLKALYQFAASTPFEIPQVLQGARTLMAMQFAAKDIVPVMRIVGDAASGLGLGQQGMERLVFHFGQIRALGTIDGRIIREMGQAGINAGQMLADALGKTVPEVMDMVHHKAIGATTAINALLAGMQDKFGGLMENQMQSLVGAWSNLKDNITLAMVEIGNTLLPTGKTIVALLSDLTAKVKEGAQWFANLPAPVRDGAIAFLAMLAALGPVLVAIGGLMMALPGLIALAGALGLTLGGLATEVVIATGGLALLIPALVALGVWVSEHTEGVKAFFAELVREIPGIGLITFALEKLTGALRGLGEWISDHKDAVVGFFRGIVEHIPGLQLAVAALNGLSDSGPVKAFEAADAAAQKAKASTAAVSKALHDLRLTGTEAFTGLSDPKEAWAAKHAEQLKIATAAVAALEDAQKKGLATAEQVAQGHKRLESVRTEKMPDFTERGPKDSTKLTDPEKAAARELDGALAHSKALFALEVDRVKFLHEIGAISDADELERLNTLSAQELAIEKDTLEKKKLIYRNNLAEKQTIDNQLASLQDKAALQLQQAAEKVEVAAEKRAKKARVEEEKTQSFMEKMALEGTALGEKMAADSLAGGARNTTIDARSSAEAAEGQVQERKLAAEREYGLQVTHTNAEQIQYMRLMAEFDRSSMTFREGALRVAAEQAEIVAKSTNNESDIARAKEAQLALSRAITDDANKLYAINTKIALEQKKQSLSGQIKGELGGGSFIDKSKATVAHTIADGVNGIAAALAKAVVQGKGLGQVFAQLGKQLAVQALTSILKAGLDAVLKSLLNLIPAFASVTAAQTAAAATTRATQSAAAIAAVSSAAGQGAAWGFESVMAALPFPVNVAVAPVVAATTLAQIMGFGAMAAFAEGGVPPMGVPSLVGERGPELFIPHEMGTIIPNHQLKAFASSGGAASISSSSSSFSGGNHTFNIHGANSPRETARAVASYLKTSNPRFSPLAR